MKRSLVICKALFAFFLLFASSAYTQSPRVFFFNPVSGPAGTSVTIFGTLFNSSVSGNTVLFGSVKATVTAASANNLTVVVPAGTTNQLITVINNANGLAGGSTREFVTTFNNPFGNYLNSNSFLPRIDYSASGQHPGAITLSDLDGDGKIDLSYLDIPSALRDPSTLYLARNTSTPGTIASPLFTPLTNSSFTGQIFTNLSASDLIGDGKQDLLLGITPPNRLSIRLNAATPGTLNANSFSSGPELPDVTGSRAVDVDWDGRPDLVFIKFDGTISILHNSSPLGSGLLTFDAAVNIPGPANASIVGIADFDGDTKPELVTRSTTASPDTIRLSIYRNISAYGKIDSSSFAPRTDFFFRTSYQNGSFAIGDVDVDGKPDVVAALYGADPAPGKIAVLRNVSTTGILDTVSFEPEVDFPASVRPDNVTLGDINGDGKLDIIYVDSNPGGVGLNTITFLFNNVFINGSITPFTFASKTSIAAPYVTKAVLLDIDTDGKPDVVTFNDLGYKYNGFGTTFLSVFKFRDQPAAPVILSVNPVSAPAGATVAINGIGFDPVPSNNIVYFGAVKATVSAGFGSLSLNATVPAGATYQPVSVLNTTTGLTAYSPRFFLPVFANASGPGVPSGFYGPKIDFASDSPAGAFPYSFAVGDVDGDGKTDMAVVHANSNSVTLLRNASPTGSLDPSSFTETTSFATGNNPLAVLIRDVNGDGKQDLIVCNNKSGTISVLRNTAVAGSINAASFDGKVDFALPAGSSPYSIAIGDINSDGKPDLVAANASLNTVSVLLNNAGSTGITAASFGPAVNFQTGNFPRAVAVSDVNRDGKPDIVVANESDQNVSVLYNTSSSGSTTISFDTRIELATGSSSPSIVFSDVDGDGSADLVLANYNSNTISVLRNTGDPALFNGSFEGPVNFATGAGPFSVGAGDADGDGKADLVIANTGSNTVSVLRNTSTAGSINQSSFAPAINFTTGVYPIAVAVADLDGDGIPEAVSANANSRGISVLKPAFSLSTPTITSFTPASGSVGTPVTITGTHFNADPVGNTVYFGAVKAAVTSASPTSLTVTVPAGSIYKPISVLNNATGLTGYSSQFFLPTFPTPFGGGILSNFYRPKVDFATASLPYFEAIGDMDGDGKSDLVTVNANNTVSVLRNLSAAGGTGGVSFAAKVDFATGNDPRSVALGDVDGDGKLDIVVADAASGTLSVLRNTSTPGSITPASFAPRVAFGTGFDAFSVAIADVNGDGKADLAATNSGLNTVSVLISQCSPGNITPASFASKVDFPTEQFPRFVIFSDVNYDGKPDLVVVNERSNSVSVLRNTITADGFDSSSFDAPVSFGVGLQPICVAAIELTNSGGPELAVSNFGNNTVTVLYNTGGNGPITPGTYYAKVDFATGPQPFFVTAADANGDGKIDLLTANAGSNTMSVLRNTLTAGNYTLNLFAPKVDFATGTYPTSVAVGDLDGDGIAEALTSNAGSNSVSIFKISPPAVSARIAPGSENALLQTTQKEIQLYPNPTRGEFTLQLTPMQGTTDIEIVHESGRSIEKRSVNIHGKPAALTLQLNLRKQAPGVYYVKFTGIAGIQVIKVVVQR